MEAQDPDEKVDRIIEMLKCIPTWQDTYFIPMLGYSDDNTPYDILWDLCREGGTLCMILNNDRKNAPIEIVPLNLNQTKPFQNISSRRNLQAFFGAVAKLQPGKELITVNQIYGDEEEDFMKLLDLVEQLMLSMDMDVKEPSTAPESTRRPSLAATTSSSDADHSTRARVIKEIIETERTYVKDLKVLQDYKEKVQNDGEHALSPESIEAIFCNLDDLLEDQEKFLEDMSCELSKPVEEQSLGSFFLESVVDREAFKEYSKFCSNYPSALEYVSQISDQLRFFDDIIKETHIHWYLIKPIQRICKYPLLLRELLKYTETSDPEHETVSDALAAVKKVTDHVNEEHRKGENIIIAKDLIKRMVNNSIYTQEVIGKLLLVEPLTVVIQSAEHEAIVYLFERYMLFCREVTRVEATTKRKITEIHLKTSIETKQLVSASNVTKDKDFRLKCLWQDGLEVQTLFLRFRIKEGLMRWLKTLILLINDIKSRRKTASPAIPLQGISVGAASVVPARRDSLKPIEEGLVVGDSFSKSTRGNKPVQGIGLGKAQDILLGKKKISAASAGRKRPKDVFDWMDDVLEGSSGNENVVSEEEDSPGFAFDQNFLEGDDHTQYNARRPTLFDKASSFIKGKKSNIVSSSERSSSAKMDFIEDGPHNEKIEKMLLGKSSTATTTKKAHKDVFAWMDDEIENAAADDEVLGEEFNDSFLHKHFVTSSLLANMNVKTISSASDQSFGQQAQGTMASKDSVSHDIFPVSGASSAKSNDMFIHAKIKYNDHCWLVPFPSFSTLKPYSMALKEAAASIMKENFNDWEDLIPFSESFEPLYLIANRLSLFYVDSDRNNVAIHTEEDFWLCLSDCTSKYAMNFRVTA